MILQKNHKRGNNISASGAFLKNKYTQSHVLGGGKSCFYENHLKNHTKGPSSVVRPPSSIIVVRTSSSSVRRPSVVRRRPSWSVVVRRPSSVVRICFRYCLNNNLENSCSGIVLRVLVKRHVKTCSNYSSRFPEGVQKEEIQQ